MILFLITTIIAAIGFCLSLDLIFDEILEWNFKSFIRFVFISLGTYMFLAISETCLIASILGG
jgi:hypothetical protein